MNIRYVISIVLLTLFFLFWGIGKVSGEEVKGTILDVRALTRNVIVDVPYERCGPVPETVRLNRKGYMGYTDGTLQRIFDRITADTATIYVNRCKTFKRKETRAVLDGYLITYTLNKRVYQTRTRIKPEGNTITIRIKHEVKP